ncbi:MAG: hypothetical protein DI580_10335 [Cutibacterium acnes]|nr:MAG: hypothetical protein DI580_10335 [Cutibacterium acnes]
MWQKSRFHLYYKVIGGCFKCGLTDHMVRDCPNNRNHCSCHNVTRI